MRCVPLLTLIGFVVPLSFDFGLTCTIVVVINGGGSANASSAFIWTPDAPPCISREPSSRDDRETKRTFVLDAKFTVTINDLPVPTLPNQTCELCLLFCVAEMFFHHFH